MADLRPAERPTPTAELVVLDPPPPPAPKYPADFEAFWDVYPRREKKGDALKAWTQAKRVAGSAATIVAGARRYREDPNRAPQFTQHPATWLRARGWEDEPLPARRPESSQDRLAASAGRMMQELGATPSRRGA